MNGKWHRDRPVKCVECGKGFTTRSRGLYCSKECSNKARNARWRLRNPAFNQGNNCLLCSKPFIASRAWQKFCSPKCQGAYNATRSKRCLLRFSILSRDGFRCRYCGRSPKDGATLQVDHIIPVALGGIDKPENLITSCFECNMGKKANTLPQSQDRLAKLRSIHQLL